MSETQQAEIQHWQARTDDMQVALERVREERDELRVAHAQLMEELSLLRQMISRIQVAMSQGQEL
jgi:predicted  nucleic acid-binding Zn-ribbon protein